MKSEQSAWRTAIYVSDGMIIVLSFQKKPTGIYDGEGKRILSAFVYDMKAGDVIMSCYSNQTIDAIGIVTGDYEYDDSFIHYKRVRKVN